ncbi:MAG: hypothetical protein HY078_00780 [Elusimicrobia bacterium]|nr:hypothetical protein [Elusimicrobiota bacterium]
MDNATQMKAAAQRPAPRAFYRWTADERILLETRAERSGDAGGDATENQRRPS